MNAESLKPLNYWDYVKTDALLSLQEPRTQYRDEKVFIMYHQVTELVFKLMLNELEQVCGPERADQTVLKDKTDRLCLYTDLLIRSFSIMRDGMNYDDYNAFRKVLSPASGFQSYQFRLIELHCTPLVNLVNVRYREQLKRGKPGMAEECFEELYWQQAGKNPHTGEKSPTLTQFEDRYRDSLVRQANALQNNTLNDKVKQLGSPDAELKESLRRFDTLFNIEWPLVHLNTASHYLDSKGETKAATGGSEWKKYLHPQFQQRRFFPELWTDQEIADWGK